MKRLTSFRLLVILVVLGLLGAGAFSYYESMSTPGPSSSEIDAILARSRASREALAKADAAKYVPITDATPVCTLAADPSDVHVGESTTLTWTSHAALSTLGPSLQGTGDVYKKMNVPSGEERTAVFTQPGKVTYEMGANSGATIGDDSTLCTTTARVSIGTTTRYRNDKYAFEFTYASAPDAAGAAPFVVTVDAKELWLFGLQFCSWYEKDGFGSCGMDSGETSPSFGIRPYDDASYEEPLLSLPHDAGALYAKNGVSVGNLPGIELVSTVTSGSVVGTVKEIHIRVADKLYVFGFVMYPGDGFNKALFDSIQSSLRFL